jgi:hypothetical protein
VPKRNRTRKFVGGPQGEDAEIVMKIPTIGELNANAKVVKDLQKEEKQQEAEKTSQKMLIEHIISWNWVDEDENVIPLPKDRSDIFELLTTEEAQFIGQCFNNRTDTQVATEKK